MKPLTTLTFTEAWRRFFTRWDRLLVIASVTSILVLIFLLPWIQGTNDLNDRISDKVAIDLAERYLSDLGYSTELYTPRVFVKRNANMLNALIREYRWSDVRKEMEANPTLHIPGYYLEVVYNPVDVDRVKLSELLELAFSEDEGRFEELMDDSRFPRIVVSLTTDGHPLEVRFTGPRDLLTTRESRTIIERLNRAPLQSDTLTIQERSVVDSLARNYVSSTYWSATNFQRDTTNVAVRSSEQEFTVMRYLSERSILERRVQLDVVLDRDGLLQRLEASYIYPNGETATSTESSLSSGWRVGTLIVLVAIGLVILVRRFSRGLIDARPSRYDALVASVALFVYLTVEATARYVRGEVFFSFDMLGQLIGIVFAGLGGWLLIFMVSIYASSVSHEVWPQKLKQLNLLRKGYVLNAPLGMTFIRSVLYGLVLCGVLVVYLAIVPHYGIHWKEEFVFMSDRKIVGAFGLISSALFNALMGMFIIFMGVTAIIYRKFRAPWVAVVTTAVAWVLIGFSPVEIYGAYHFVGLLTIIGLAMGGIFWRHGPVTAAFTFVMLVVSWNLFNGLVIARNPDWIQLALLAVSMGGMVSLGFVGLRTNTTSEELPDYIPPYLVEMANRQRMERELEIARQVQLSFLPESTPKIEGLELAANCFPASEVGGDYYDFLPASKGALGLVIGDVSGKGIQASFYMTLVKGFTRSLSADNDDPGSFMERINRLFYENARRGTFVSMIYGLMDVENGTFRFARAGHNPLILVRSSKREVTVVNSSGLAIGLIHDSERFCDVLRPLEIQLDKGDMLVLYTDGYTEAMNNGKRLYGEERLIEVIRTHIGSSAEDMLTKINEDVRSFTDGREQSDDMTMVIVRRL